MKSEVTFDYDMVGFDQDICKSLTFDLVRPIKIQGYLANYEGKVVIKMDNGDEIEMNYQHPTSHTHSIELTQKMKINDEKYRELGNEESLQELIRKHYKQHLKEKLKRRGE